MADWPLLFDGQTYETGANTTSTGGIIVTSDGTNNTKGSYTAIIASTTYTGSWLFVTLGFSNTSGTDHLVDIAFGGVGSEVIVAPDLVACTGTDDSLYQYIIPISCPAGTRIAARSQSTTGGATIRCAVTVMGAGFSMSSPLSRMTAYGATAADSGGIQIDPGGSANTKGGYSEITASMTNPARALIVAIGNRANTARSAARCLLDIAAGSAGNEVVILPNLFFTMMPAGDVLSPTTWALLPCYLPAGTRLAAQAQSSITGATARLFDIVVWGLD